ncbi:MAG: hypothetical protein JOS17DRAFT_779296 [Linnemannia elongata]|nr:MAG: hypothetical protein JOS17DRAFT_779296 [Linnemannia elongata]
MLAHAMHAKHPRPSIGLRSENLVKPRAVAYKVLARYKVSVEAFCCCGSQKPLNGDQPHQWSAIREAFFLSTIRHPAGRSSIAWELYTTKTLKPLKSLTSSIDFMVTKITLLEYQFHTSAGAGDNLYAWVKEGYLKIKKALGQDDLD